MSYKRITYIKDLCSTTKELLLANKDVLQQIKKNKEALEDFCTYEMLRYCEECPLEYYGKCLKAELEEVV